MFARPHRLAEDTLSIAIVDGLDWYYRIVLAGRRNNGLRRARAAVREWLCSVTPMKIGILISGRGSNMAALIDAAKSGEILASEVVVVISDKSDAAGLEKARERGVETLVIERRGRKRAEHDAEILAELKKRGTELVCLAGYMRLLSPSFIRAFPNRIVNIHPSLLPSFPGLNVQQQAIDHGVKISGCTVHFVNEELDAGPIILQRAVEVKDDDTAETLAARILEQEHPAYVEAVRRIAGGWVKLDGRRTYLTSESEKFIEDYSE